jgi:predicted nucleic acid-binding protein
VADLLLDTDVLVDHLRGATAIKLGKLGKDRLHYSVITRAELFAGTTATDAVARLLGAFRELVVDRAVAERAGRVKRQTGIRMPDALIAATALEHRMSLVTRNLRDFKQVPGLRIRASHR